MNQFRYLLLLSLISLVLFSCNLKNDKPKEINPLMVDAMVITHDSTNLQHSYVGIVQPINKVSISFGTGGYLQSLLVKNGDRVSKNQVVAVIDNSNASNTYNASKASLDQAQDAYNRLKKVYDSGSLTEIQWVDIQTKLEQARSIERLSYRNLQECELKIPFDGVIGSCFVEAGMHCSPMQPVVSVMDISQIYIEFAIPEKEISSVSIGQDATISISALNNRIIHGTISEKGVVADPLAHSYTVMVKLDNSQCELLPGMVCKITMDDPNYNNCIEINADAIQTSIDGYFVWLYSGGKAYRRPVEVLNFNVQGVLLSSGVNLNDTIITSGYIKLSEGSDVEG